MAEGNKTKKAVKSRFNADKFKKGISHVESSGGRNLWNENSSGTGKYQFLYNEIKHLPEMKGISREQFRDNPELQEKVMDMAMNDKLVGVPGLYKNAEDLTRDYKDSLGDKWNFREDEIAAMSHFLGRQGARKYLRSLRDGVSYEVSDSKNNKSVEDYLATYNKGIKGYQESEPLRNRPNDVQLPAYDRHTNYSERVINSRPTNPSEGRQNADGTHSSVLMTQSDNEAFPTLFQNEDKSWTELPWREARQRAGAQDEVYRFDNEQQAADFAEGSWKKQSAVPNFTPSVFAEGGELGMGSEVPTSNPGNEPLNPLINYNPTNAANITLPAEANLPANSAFPYPEVNSPYGKGPELMNMNPTGEGQPYLRKTWDVAVSPTTAARELLNTGKIPDNMGKALDSGELHRSNFDIAIDVKNPAAAWESLKKGYQSLLKGDLTTAAIKSLGVIPAFKKLRSLDKFLKIGSKIKLPNGKVISALQDAVEKYNKIKALQYANTTIKTGKKVHKPIKYYNKFDKNNFNSKDLEEREVVEFAMGGELNPIKGDPQTQQQDNTSVSLPLGKEMSFNKKSIDRQRFLKSQGLSAKQAAEIVAGVDVVKPAQLTQDNRTSRQRELNQEISDKINNEKINLEKGLIYLDEPGKILGDLGMSQFNNSEEDRKKIKLQKYGKSKGSKFDLAKQYLPGAIMNTALGVYGAPSTTTNSFLPMLNEVLNPLAGGASIIAKEAKGAIKNLSQLKKLNKILNEVQNQKLLLNSPEGRRRLKQLGLNENVINNKLRDSKITFARDGSYSTTGKIAKNDRHLFNFDVGQGRQLNEAGMQLSDNDIVVHEIGHLLQRPDANPGMASNALRKQGYSNFNDIRVVDTAIPTKVDTYLGQLRFNREFIEANGEIAKHNYWYFNNGSGKDITEKLPFLREMRNSMKEKGFIKHEYDEISKEVIEKFMKKNPKNRMSSFVNPTSENLKVLTKALNVLPMAGGVVLGGKQMMQQNTNIKAQGGQLNNNIMNDNKNILTEFGAGGSHESNPFGGIQQGTGSNGKPNMVEEGETKKGSYIYSDRLILDKDTIAKSGLPKKFIGKTFAEASKILNKPTKDNEDDRITMDTAKENLDRLQASQEEFKASMMPPQQQQQQPGQQQQGQPGMEMMQQGQFAMGGNMYANAGELDLMPGAGVDTTMAGSGTPLGVETGGAGGGFADMGAIGKAGAIAGGAGAAIDLGKTAFGKSDVDMSGNIDPSKVEHESGQALGGLAKGASAGAAFGPWGAAVGGVVGLGAGLLSANKQKKDMIAAQGMYDTKQFNKANMQYATGGQLNMPGPGGPGGPVKGVPLKDANRVGDNLVTPRAQGPIAQDDAGFIDSLGQMMNKEYKIEKRAQDEARLGTFPEIGERIPHPSGSGYRDVMFNDTQGGRTLTRDSKNNYYLNNSRVSRAQKGGHTAGPGAERVMNSQQANYFMRNTPTNIKADGGFLNPNDGYGNNSYAFAGDLNDTPPTKDEPFDFQSAQSQETEIPRVGARPEASNITKQQESVALTPQEKAKFNTIKSSLPSNVILPESTADNKDGFNWGSALRYAPAAMNAFQLATQKKPDIETLDRLGNRYKPKYVDEQAMMNKINNAGNINEAMANASGGSSSTYRTNLLAGYLNKTKATSDAYLNATNINRGEDAKAQGFNLGVDKANLSQSNLEAEKNARNKGAYDTNKSKLLAQLGNDLGGIGLEEVRKKYPELAGMDYDTQGRYISWIKSEEKRKKAEKADKKASR